MHTLFVLINNSGNTLSDTLGTLNSLATKLCNKIDVNIITKNEILCILVYYKKY